MDVRKQVLQVQALTRAELLAELPQTRSVHKQVNAQLQGRVLLQRVCQGLPAQERLRAFEQLLTTGILRQVGKSHTSHFELAAR